MLVMSLGNGPICLAISPSIGSIFITLAPKSASNFDAKGAAICCPISITFNASNNLGSLFKFSIVL